MDFFGRLKRSVWPGRLWLLVVLLAAACGGGSSSSPESAGTSALSFQVVWDRPDFQGASLTDCADVDTVSAAVYTEAGDLLGEGGPWDCLTGSGVIAGLPANHYATIVVAGYGPDGTPLYAGQSAIFFLNPGSVDGGVITAGPFVPTLLSPNDEAIVAQEALTLRWAPLINAGGYVVTLAMSDAFTASSIIAEQTISDPGITRFAPDADDLQVDMPFYWRVRALAADGRPGTPSSSRQFSIRPVTVTSVTFVGDDSAGTPNDIQTTVAFSYATIDYTRVRISDGAVVAQWSAEMDSSDYFALQEIITTNELQNHEDITEGEIACTGWSGLTVSMVYLATTYAFSIDSQVCDLNDWGEVVAGLVELKDDLVSAYQP